MSTYDGPWEDVEYDDDNDEGVAWGAQREYDGNHLRFAASCPECGFTSRDVHLLNNHSCYVTQNGGRCEDYPCCGHEMGDCNGLLYGSDESIKEQVYRAARDEDYAYAMERQADYDDYWG